MDIGWSNGEGSVCGVSLVEECSLPGVIHQNVSSQKQKHRMGDGEVKSTVPSALVIAYVDCVNVYVPSENANCGFSTRFVFVISQKISRSSGSNGPV